MQEMLNRGNLAVKEGGGGGQVAFASPRATNQLKVRWAKVSNWLSPGSKAEVDEDITDQKADRQRLGTR